MREAVVVASSRTPLAKSFRGSFNLTRPDDLAAHCITSALKKVPQLDPEHIDDLMLGCGLPGGESGYNMEDVSMFGSDMAASSATAMPRDSRKQLSGARTGD